MRNFLHYQYTFMRDFLLFCSTSTKWTVLQTSATLRSTFAVNAQSAAVE